MICRNDCIRYNRRFPYQADLLFAYAVLFLTLFNLPSVHAVEVAAALPLTGDEAAIGEAALQGIQLAIEEANADGARPHIELAIYDDRSNDDEAKKLASQIVASRATVVLGPALTTASVAAGPTYAQAGLVAITPTAAGDTVTQNATTFRVVLKNSEQGKMIAIYLTRVIGGRRADVIVADNPYGHSLEAGYVRAAGRLGIDAQYFSLKTPDESEDIARRVAADTDQPSVVFLMLDGEAARILPTLRRLGVRGPFVGGSGLGDESFSRRMADLPEEHQQAGYFTEGMYCMSPIILDSANSEVLAFAERFRARFGHDPFWFAAGGYDAAHLAAVALRATAGGTAEGAEARTARTGGGADVRATRNAVLNYLTSLNDPARAVSGLLGPLWFDEARGRPEAVRMGRFNRGRFESAPLQIIPVTTPSPAEIASGAVFELEPGRYARLQRVVYTGMFINEIPHLDLLKSSFGADFYLWLRFARDAGPDSADPTDINFPNLISGNFDRAHPAEQREMPDGTEYRLWRVQGEFHNDFDQHRFPFDRQTLSLPFFNARAAADQIVYVLDRRSSVEVQKDQTPLPPNASSGETTATPMGSTAPSKPAESLVSADAFRELTQWRPRGASERRENLVTESALGDPRRFGAESYRELSGFLVVVELERRAMATLTKALLPLLLMTLILYGSLHFPSVLVKEKVTVAVTAALSGAVLLTAINNQLGSIGYTVAVEYAFYVFFGLSLLCIISCLGVERLHSGGRRGTATVTERWTRIIFLLAVAAMLLGALTLHWSQSR